MLGPAGTTFQKNRMIGCRVMWFACVLVTLLHSCAQNLASSLGSLASFAETAAQLGGAINTVKTARESSVSNSSGGVFSGRKNANNETSTSPVFSTPLIDQNGLKQVAEAFNALRECNPDSDGLCCVLRDYCDPNASCYSDVTASNVAEYMNAIPQCDCVAGFQGDGTTRGNGCTNINECERIPRVCDQLCVDYAPGYGCGCREGFTLANDNYSCLDIDECQKGIAKCSHECLNTEGSYTCLCPSGFELDANSHTCIDIDECALRTCEYPDLCENYDGSFSCGCPPGYAPSEIDTRLCVDIDECTSGLILPLAEARIHFSANDFQEFPSNSPEVEALASSELSPQVVQVAACPANKGQSCFNFVGGFACKCQLGYNSVPRTEERLTSTVGQGNDDTAAAVSLFAITYRSAANLSLFAKTFSVDSNTPAELREYIFTAAEHLNTATRSTCEDINECVVVLDSPLNLDVCRSEVSFEGVKTATDTLWAELQESGVYPSTAQLFCTPEGDYGNPQRWSEVATVLQSVSSNPTTTTEPPQCLAPAAADTSDLNPPVCENSVGAFECRCSEGYLYDWSKRQCVDIDECAVDRHDCSRQTENCINGDGTYYCECKEGFKIPSSVDVMSCVDINECTEGLSRCDGECHNVDGSYYCSCSEGLELASDGYTCIDVDECSAGLCPAACLNTEGSYICACQEGFVDASFVDSLTGAVKIPQATNFEWPASIMEAARDIPKGELSPEFIGQVREVARDKLGVRCVDVNECALTDSCPLGFTCINTFGSFECTCPVGYTFQPEGETNTTGSSSSSVTQPPASSTNGNRRKRFSVSDSITDTSGAALSSSSSSSTQRSTAVTLPSSPGVNRGVNQMLGSAIAAMSGQSALLQGMSAVAAGGSGANRALSHGNHRLSTPVQWGRRPRELQLMSTLQQSWNGSSLGSGLNMGGRNGNKKNGRGWVDNDNNGNDSTTGTEIDGLVTPASGAFVLGHEIKVNKAKAAEWMEGHLQLGKHHWRRLSQCQDEDECTAGVRRVDGSVVAPCDVDGPTPCCYNLAGTYECLKKTGVFSSKACPLVNGYWTSEWSS